MEEGLQIPGGAGGAKPSVRLCSRNSMAWAGPPWWVSSSVAWFWSCPSSLSQAHTLSASLCVCLSLSALSISTFFSAFLSLIFFFFLSYLLHHFSCLFSFSLFIFHSSGALSPSLPFTLFLFIWSLKQFLLRADSLRDEVLVHMSKSLSDLKFALVVATYILPAKDFYILSSFSFKRADIYLIKKKWGKNHFFYPLFFLFLLPSPWPFIYQVKFYHHLQGQFCHLPQSWWADDSLWMLSPQKFRDSIRNSFWWLTHVSNLFSCLREIHLHG